jgi:hypothetical protein
MTALCALRVDRRGHVFVEYLILIAVLGLGLLAGLRKLGSDVDQAARHEGAALVAMSSLSSATTEQGSEPVAPNSEPAPAAPDSPSLLHRLGHLGLQVLGGTYNAASALIPDPVKPLIREANQLGLGLLFDGADKLLPDFVKDGALTGAEQLVGALDRVLEKSPAPGPLKSFADKLTAFDFQAFRKDEGLHGDWYRLYKVWLTESRPSDLGVWDSVEGRDRVTIRDPSYTGDLRARPQNQQAIDAFFAKYGDDPPPNASLVSHFSYNGPDSAEGGSYTALESFTGSYATKLTYLGPDAHGEPLFQVEVTNESHWESGTRVPGSGQKLTGGREYLVPDEGRGRGLGVGGDFTQRFIWTQPGRPSHADAGR